MRGWYYDKEQLPSLESIRCPGNQRTLSAAPLPDAPSDDHSKEVWKRAIEPSPDVFRINTPIRVNKLKDILKEFPNTDHLASWVKALTEGLWPWSNSFPDDPPEGVIFPNPPQMDRYRTFINTIRAKEVSMGHWREIKTAIPYFRNSPLSVVPKPEGGNRLIQNLSFPDGNSVNDQIPEEEGKVVYDDIASLAKVIIVLHSMGKKGWVPWKLDVSRAFRNIPLHPLFSLRNGIIIRSRRGKSISYIDSQACFGGRPFPRAFCSLEDMIGWAATEKFGVSILLRFVDDHFGISFIEPGETEPVDMLRLREVFGLLDVPTNDKHGCGDGLVIIGKEINYAKATIQFSREKLIRYLTTCDHFARAATMTIKELEHVCGVLNYCIEIYPIGKPYSSMLDAIKAKYFGRSPRQSIDVSDEMRETFKWWGCALASRPVRYLLEEYWWPASNADEVIYTDASTSGGLGFYRVKKKSAYYHLYDTSSEVIRILQGPRKDAKIHINIMEMLTVLAAVQIVNADLPSNEATKFRLVVMCDNASVCDDIWKLKAGSYIANALMKDLVDELKSIDIRVCHINTRKNPADLLTKGADMLEEFKASFPVDEMHQFNPPSLQEYLLNSSLIR